MKMLNTKKNIAALLKVRSAEKAEAALVKKMRSAGFSEDKIDSEFRNPAGSQFETEITNLSDLWNESNLVDPREKGNSDEAGITGQNI